MTTRCKKVDEHMIYSIREYLFLTRFKLYIHHLELMATLAGSKTIEGFADKFNNDKQIILLLKRIFAERSEAGDGTKK